MTERKLYIEPYKEEIEKEDIKYEKIDYIYDVDHNICIHKRKIDKELNVGVVYDFTYEHYDDEDTYSYLILKKEDNVYYYTEHYNGKFIQTKENHLASGWNKYTSEEIKKNFGIDMDEWMNEEINDIPTWKYEKFMGDAAIYAECPICGFWHCVGDAGIHAGHPEIRKQYNFCPSCGTYLYSDEEESEVIWNERTIMEKLGIEEVEEEDEN